MYSNTEKDEQKPTKDLQKNVNDKELFSYNMCYKKITMTVCFFLLYAIENAEIINKYGKYKTNNEKSFLHIFLN